MECVLLRVHVMLKSSHSALTFRVLSLLELLPFFKDLGIF